jgi:hypothetical protein
MKASLGKGMVITTTLANLHNDKFEGTNIIGKKIILISDSDDYHKDLSVLKALTGGDCILGRIKHQQGSVEILVRALTIIVGNQALSSTDTGGAITRRQRQVLMDQKPKNASILLDMVTLGMVPWQRSFLLLTTGLSAWTQQRLVSTQYLCQCTLDGQTES